MSINVSSNKSTRDAVRTRLAELVCAACDGSVSVEEVTGWAGQLAALGVSSLAQLRIVDAVETEFEIYLELDGPLAFLSTLDSLTDYVVQLLGKTDR